MTKRNENILDRIAKPTPVEAKKNAKVLSIVSVISAIALTGAFDPNYALYAIAAICGGGVVYNSQKVIK